jgi:alpha-methylacyl-CoA racemase
MGPLASLKVIELAGIGPRPMAATLLADTGATVLRIDWPAAQYNLTLCGRRTLALDFKQPPARGLALPPVAEADALTEAFRPGVAERLGLGPADCLACNPRLAYGRMTGWGQEGSFLPAGHDLNYIALTGALHHIGRKAHRLCRRLT